MGYSKGDYNFITDYTCQWTKRTPIHEFEQCGKDSTESKCRIIMMTECNSSHWFCSNIYRCEEWLSIYVGPSNDYYDVEKPDAKSSLSILGKEFIEILKVIIESPRHYWWCGIIFVGYVRDEKSLRKHWKYICPHNISMFCRIFKIFFFFIFILIRLVASAMKSNYVQLSTIADIATKSEHIVLLLDICPEMFHRIQPAMLSKLTIDWQVRCTMNRFAVELIFLRRTAWT